MFSQIKEEIIMGIIMRSIIYVFILFTAVACGSGGTATSAASETVTGLSTADNTQLLND